MVDTTGDWTRRWDTDPAWRMEWEAAAAEVRRFWEEYKENPGEKEAGSQASPGL